MEVIDLSLYRKRDPRHVGRPVLLYKGQLQVQLPLSFNMRKVRLDLGVDESVEALRFDRGVAGGYLPFFFKGRVEKLRRRRGRKINCLVQIFQQHYKDTSYQVGVYFQHRYYLESEELPQLRVVHRAPINFPDHEVLSQYPLHDDIDGRIVILRKTLIEKHIKDM